MFSKSSKCLHYDRTIYDIASENLPKTIRILDINNLHIARRFKKSLLHEEGVTCSRDWGEQ